MLAPDTRSNTTWLSAPIRRRQYQRGVSAASLQQIHERRRQPHAMATLPTIECVPISWTRRYTSQPLPNRDRIDVWCDRTECGRGGGAGPEAAAPIERDQRPAENDVRERVHERERLIEPFVGIALRVPVSVEVIPVIGMFPQAFAELIGELLGGALESPRRGDDRGRRESDRRDERRTVLAARD